MSELIHLLSTERNTHVFDIMHTYLSVVLHAEDRTNSMAIFKSSLLKMYSICVFSDVDKAWLGLLAGESVFISKPGVLRPEIVYYNCARARIIYNT